MFLFNKKIVPLEGIFESFTQKIQLLISKINTVCISWLQYSVDNKSNLVELRFISIGHISGSFMLLTLSITKVLFYKQHVIKIKNSYPCTVASLGLKASYFDFISLHKPNIPHLKIDHSLSNSSITELCMCWIPGQYYNEILRLLIYILNISDI